MHHYTPGQKNSPPPIFEGIKCLKHENDKYNNRKIKLQRWSSTKDHAFIHTQYYFSDINQLKSKGFCREWGEVPQATPLFVSKDHFFSIFITR